MNRNLFKVAFFLVLAIVASSCFFKSDYGFDTDLFPVKSGDKWGYIDHKGKYVINPQFDAAELFRNGLARVESADGKVGFIDKKGKYVINPEYIDATPFSSGVALVVREGDYISGIDKKGNEIFKLQQAKYAKWFTENMAAFCNKEGKWGFVDKSGTVVINPQFESVHPFSEGLAAVCDKNDKWGFIDKDGTLVINYQFEHVDDFSDGLAAFSNGDKAGYISKKGEYAINPQFDHAFRFHDGKAAVVQGKLAGFIDKKGQYLINPQFDFEVDPIFMDGLAAVSSGDKAGFIDEKGKYVINPQFDFAYPFIDGLSAVYTGKQFGFVNEKGKYVINPQFDRVFTDLYEMFSGIAPSVTSDYYDANAFATKWFDLRATTTSFDAIGAGSTLQAIEDSPKYQDGSLYSREVSYGKAQEITEDISIDHVYFYFDGDTYYYDYWYYTRNLNHSLPISAVRYDLDLNNDAIGKARLVAKALKNKFADNYGVSFEEITKDKNVYYMSLQPEGKLSFVIMATEYSCEVWIGPNGENKLNAQIEKHSYIASKFDEVMYEEIDDEPVAEEAVEAVEAEDFE